MRQAVLLLSSGLDSAANLALAEDFRVAVALTIDYGQRGAPRELEKASRLARHFGVEHVTFDLRGFGCLAGSSSALLRQDSLPAPESLDDLAVTSKTAKAVWVPNRNGVMISLAAALAEARGLDAVAVGFNVEEAVTFPDNSEAFMGAMSEALGFSTSNKVRVVSATARFNKREIIARLAPRGFPFELLWSCYESGERHCGRCESCQRLKRAVAEGLAGVDRDRARAALFGEVG